MTESKAQLAAFFYAAPIWRAELQALRGILLDCGLQETYKWRGPCYCHAGGNVALLWGFKDAATLGFFKGVLLDDPDTILRAPGENSRAVRIAEFRDLVQISAIAETLRTYIRAAIALETSGAKIACAQDDQPYPEELIIALEHDPELAEAFDALTPGRRRAYLLHFNQAKASATKTSRIEKHRPRILQRKGMNDR